MSPNDCYLSLRSIQKGPSQWRAPFIPKGKGKYFSWPLITDLMPWQHSGLQAKRMWPIAPDKETLKVRWDSLLSAKQKRVAFRETGDRKIDREHLNFREPFELLSSLESIDVGSECPSQERYLFRSFDRHFIIADSRLIDRPRPPLWNTLSDKQIFISSLASEVLGKGPAVTVSQYIPDLNSFRGSYGGKDILPLYRSNSAQEPNFHPDLIKKLNQIGGLEVSPNTFIAYLYAILAQPSFTIKYWSELEDKEVRIPITKDKKLFEEAVSIGKKLIWLHTFGGRFAPEGNSENKIPSGLAKCTKAISDKPSQYPNEFSYDPDNLNLKIGNGIIGPVSEEIWEFEVSGLKIVHSWLGYRMIDRKGRKSSPLDDIHPKRWTGEFTTELLTLLWILEETLKIYPDQNKLLEEIISGPVLKNTDFGKVPEELRRPPKISRRMDSNQLEI